MKRTIPLFLVISFFALSCKTTQAPSVSQTEVALPDNLTFVHPIDFIELDKFENVYIIHQQELLLLTKDGKEVAYRYENDRLGNITSVDISNPLKIFLFYDDYDVVITLDNTLTEISQIDFSRLGYSDIKQAALSNDNNVWIYDPVTFTLKKINRKGMVLATSDPLYAQYIEPYHTTRLRETNNKVYLSDTELGVLEFDNFGQYIKTIPLKGLEDFQIINKQIIYCDQKGVFFYGMQFYDIIQMEALDEEDRDLWKRVRISKDKIYIVMNQGLRIQDR